MPPLLGLCLLGGTDLLAAVGGALVVAVPDDRLHRHQVDDALEARLRADRQLQHRRLRIQAVLDHLHGAEEVGAGAVHLVDEAHPRHVVAVGLPPDGLRLRLDAGHRVEHGHRAIEDPQRALDLDREVDVARRVDDVDAVVVPERRGGRRRDGDPALLLLGHVVHDRGALVDLADLVGLAGVVEDALGGRRLAGIDVRHDADVAVALERELTLGQFDHLLRRTNTRKDPGHRHRVDGAPLGRTPAARACSRVAGPSVDRTCVGSSISRRALADAVRDLGGCSPSGPGSRSPAGRDGP